MLPKLIITDIDGVWTDGSMYYDQTGNEQKRFHTYDSAGVLFARLLKIPVAIITGEDTEIVNRRAKKLNVEYLFQGIKDKVAVVESICRELNISFQECAFIGDDINDVLLLQKVGLGASPQNAPEYVKSKAHYITQKKGGEGAFREFVEYILKENNILEETLKIAIERNGKTS